MTDNRYNRRKEEGFVNKDTQYNFGGWTPQEPFLPQPSPSVSLTPTPTKTTTPTPTPTITSTSTSTPTPTITSTSTPTPSITSTPSITNTPTITTTPTMTPSSSAGGGFDPDAAAYLIEVIRFIFSNDCVLSYFGWCERRTSLEWY
jgi:hypothetical protein